ncbi:unnamed protein product [Caenorhabditis bovis]|uniref:Uncharacterized protein n=1 Tax=Caenorhabditis bovis TaxID=2654633 RepID=A0A8S1FCC3_9PELO|nr:unnamed protein product [Caenorhabditis bovis]
MILARAHDLLKRVEDLVHTNYLMIKYIPFATQFYQRQFAIMRRIQEDLHRIIGHSHYISEEDFAGMEHVVEVQEYWCNTDNIRELHQSFIHS